MRGHLADQVLLTLPKLQHSGNLSRIKGNRPTPSPFEAQEHKGIAIQAKKGQEY
jgi:hypothetical protein